MQACNLSTQETEEGGSGIEGWAGLHEILEKRGVVDQSSCFKVIEQRQYMILCSIKTEMPCLKRVNDKRRPQT